MTKIKNEVFTCPKCGSKSEIKIYDSINVDLDEDLKEKVLSGEIFSWKCPQCKQEYNIHYDFLYHDLKNDFMIYYSPNGCERINKIVNDMFSKYKGMRSTLCRSTSDYNRFLEKIRIFESDFNDIAIEFAKFLIKNGKDNKVPDDCNVFFDKYIPDENNGILVFRLMDSTGLRKENILLGKESYDEYEKTVKEDTKFNMAFFCETIDEDWLFNRL